MIIRNHYDHRTEAETEALIAAAIRNFRQLPPEVRANLIHQERPASTGPNPCAEIVLDRPVEPGTVGTKEPGARAFDTYGAAFYPGASLKPWANVSTDQKARWAAVEQACQPVIEPVVAEDCYLTLENLIDQMRMLKGQWRYHVGGDLTAFTNLPEQALACLIGMKAEITAFEAQFAPNPDHKPLSEPDAFKIEAAMQYGFIPHDDDATIYRATEQQIVNLMDAAQKQGRDDVKDLDTLRVERQELSDQLIEKLSSKPAQYGHDEGLRRRTTRIVEINNLIKEIMTNG